MNQQIEQLAEQCWVHTNEPLFAAKSPHWEFDRQKFAELIVRECAGLFPNVYVEIETEYGHTPVVASEYIKKHFGFEE